MDWFTQHENQQDYSMYKVKIQWGAGGSSEAWFWKECPGWEHDGSGGVVTFCHKMSTSSAFIILAWVASIVAAISGCLQAFVNKAPEFTWGARMSIIFGVVTSVFLTVAVGVFCSVHNDLHGLDKLYGFYVSILVVVISWVTTGMACVGTMLKEKPLFLMTSL